jgi:hypothetical protein
MSAFYFVHPQPLALKLKNGIVKFVGIKILNKQKCRLNTKNIDKM